MQTSWTMVVSSIVIAFMLAIMPLPDWAQSVRPDWVTLVLIYWAMALPANIGVVVAWIMGLFLDVSHGALLGEHAIGLVVVIYVVHTWHQRLRVASLLQQALVVFFLLLLKQLIVLWVNGMMGHAPDTLLYFVPSFVGALLWPWIYIIMRDLRRRAGISRI